MPNDLICLEIFTILFECGYWKLGLTIICQNGLPGELFCNRFLLGIYQSIINFLRHLVKFNAYKFFFFSLFSRFANVFVVDRLGKVDGWSEPE